jgi:hypothetical protein
VTANEERFPMADHHSDDVREAHGAFVAQVRRDGEFAYMSERAKRNLLGGEPDRSALRPVRDPGRPGHADRGEQAASGSAD